jgi:DNA-binding MarR family transcriptional regulator
MVKRLERMSKTNAANTAGQGSKGLEEDFAGALTNGNSAEIEKVLKSIRQVIRATDLHSRHVTRLVGLTTSQLILLKVVRDQKLSTISELANMISLSQATLTSILDRLEAQGYVLRERSAQDKRKVQVHITEVGREVLEMAPEPLQDTFIRQFSALKDWERGMIQASLQRVVEMMDAGSIDASPLLDVGQLGRRS